MQSIFKSWLLSQDARRDEIGLFAREAARLNMPEIDDREASIGWAEKVSAPVREGCVAAWKAFLGIIAGDLPASFATRRAMGAQESLAVPAYMAWRRMGCPSAFSVDDVEDRGANDDEIILTALLPALSDVGRFESAAELLAANFSARSADMAEAFVLLKMAIESVGADSQGLIPHMGQAITCLVSYGNASQVVLAVSFIKASGKDVGDFCTSTNREGILLYAEAMVTFMMTGGSGSDETVRLLKKAVSKGCPFAQFELSRMAPSENPHTELGRCERAAKGGDLRCAFNAGFMRNTLRRDGAENLVFQSARAGHFDAFADAARLLAAQGGEAGREGALFAAAVTYTRQARVSAHRETLFSIINSFRPELPNLSEDERNRLLLKFISDMPLTPVMKETISMGASLWRAVFSRMDGLD